MEEKGGKLNNYNPSLKTLKLLMFSYFATSTIIVSYLPLYLNFRGLTSIQIGWVLAIKPFVSIFAQPFWGYLSDKFKTVKYILIFCILTVLITGILFFQLGSLPLFFIVGSIFFFVAAPIEPLSDSIALRSSLNVGVSFGSIRMWGAIGFAVSSLLVGKYLTFVGIEYIYIPFIFFGVIAFIYACKVIDVKVESEPIQLKDTVKIFKNKSFVVFLILILFLMITHNANDNFIGLYIGQLGGDNSLIGMAWFVGVFSEGIVYATASYWFRKYHPLVFVIIAGLLYSLRWWLYAIVDDPTLIIVLQFLHGLSFGVFFIAAFEYVTRLIPNLLQSTGHLVFFSSIGVSGIIGSLVGGALFDKFGGSTLYFILCALSVLGTACILFYQIFLVRGSMKSRA